MKREEALQILKKYLKDKSLQNHCLATEACMKAVFEKIYPNGNKTEKSEWGIAGLLHDADYETTRDTPQKHGLALFELEENTQFPQNVKYAIQAHNFEHTGVEPQSALDWALIACDPVTGLIVASALVTPEKKLANLQKKSVLKKYRQKSFAKGVEREKIALCEEKLGIPLDEFVEVSLTAMQEIASDIDL